MLTWHQLGIHKKPVGFLNIAGRSSWRQTCVATSSSTRVSANLFVQLQDTLTT